MITDCLPLLDPPWGAEYTSQAGSPVAREAPYSHNSVLNLSNSSHSIAGHSIAARSHSTFIRPSLRATHSSPDHSTINNLSPSTGKKMQTPHQHESSPDSEYDVDFAFSHKLTLA